LSFGGLPSSGGTSQTGSGGSGIITTLPSDFTKTEIGGYKRGASLDDGASSGNAGAGGTAGGGNASCGNILLGVLRDFKGKDEPGGHADFETFIGTGPTLKLVADTLDADRKVVYASKCELGATLDKALCPYNAQTTTKANFDQWYRNTPNVNKAFIGYFFFQPMGNGLFTFLSNNFFPVDGAGWNNTPKFAHNFHFTTELHTQFQYNGGETFKFTGDDDVWVFVNNKLAVDLGGLHEARDGEVNLDARANELGIQKGNIYALDLFHAERHSVLSNFRIDTNLAFVNCGTLPPDVVK
jgi:fibro-slime domain-containing protein